MRVSPRQALAGLIIMGATAIGAGGATANQGGDSVRGAGQNNPPDGTVAHFQFNASSAADGSDPAGRGHFKVTQNQSTSKGGQFGTVTCLRVAGSAASFILALDHTGKDVPDNVVGLQVYVKDNGKKKGNAPVDQVRNQRLFDGADLTACGDPATGIPHDFPVITKGDVEVVDN